MPRSKKVNPDSLTLRAEYDAIVPRALRLLSELDRQVLAIVEGAKAPLAFPVETRLKTWDSITAKSRRNALRLKSIADLHDLCGMRIVTLFRRDAERVAEVIGERFTVLVEEDKSLALTDTSFGYASIHLVVEIPGEWSRLPTLSDLTGLRIEIQVRSVAQHLWAAASHVFQYKTEASVPPPVRRSLSRVAALLELVDIELARVVEERIGYRERIGTSTNAMLNADVLEKTLDSTLPAENKDTDELYEDLLEELLHFEIDTPLKVRSLVRKQLPRVIEREKEIVNSIRTRQPDEMIYEWEERAVQEGVYFAHSGLVRIALGLEFGKAWETYQDQKSTFLSEHYPLPDEE